MKWLAALCLAMSLSCAALTAPPSQPVSNGLTIVLSDDLRSGAHQWRAVAERRFLNPIVIACHGDSASGPVWVLRPDRLPPMPVWMFVRIAKQFAGGRPIVVVACNARGDALRGEPGVWYARDVVWTEPGPTTRRSRTTGKMEQWVGNIGAFEEAK